MVEGEIQIELRNVWSVSCTTGCRLPMSLESYITVIEHFINEQLCPNSYTATTHQFKNHIALILTSMW